MKSSIARRNIILRSHSYQNVRGQVDHAELPLASGDMEIWPVDVLINTSYMSVLKKATKSNDNIVAILQCLFSKILVSLLFHKGYSYLYIC